jgi:hypothetical protein
MRGAVSQGRASRPSPGVPGSLSIARIQQELGVWLRWGLWEVASRYTRSVTQVCGLVAAVGLTG